MAIKISINAYLTNLKGIGVMNCHDDKNQCKFEKHHPQAMFQSQLVKKTWHWILLIMGIKFYAIMIHLSFEGQVGVVFVEIFRWCDDPFIVRMMIITENSQD